MSLQLRQRIFEQLDSLVLIDPHTHINPHSPASRTLADILGYHYYTELAHSAGMPKARIEEEGLDPKEKVARLIANLGPIENTVQYSWFVEMCQVFFGFEEDRVTTDNWEPLYDAAAEKMQFADWPQQVLAESKLEAVYLTNDFDDPLEKFDTSVYVPCLRTDDLVFNLAHPDVRKRLENASRTSVGDADSLRDAIGALFTHFKQNGARACAISLPPDFAPTRITPGRAATAVETLCSQGRGADESHRRAAASFVFWTLAEFCADFRLPFDLMIGVNRGVYEAGVFQGRDLYDSRVSLIQYRELFNAFPQVTFPISVLASVTNQELTSYAWIFPNVVTNGHWWYSNTPTYIEHDAAARLEAVPRTKQIAYYSDMYKLEFALPKFAMYKRILAKILAERFVIDRGWSEERAVEFGTQVLRGNVETVFGYGDQAPAVFGTAGVASAALVEAAEPEATGEESADTQMNVSEFGLLEGEAVEEAALESEDLEPEVSEAAFDMADEGIPVGESAEGVPMGDVLEGIPVGDVAEGIPIGDVAEGIPVGDVAEGIPGGDVAEGIPMGEVVEEIDISELDTLPDTAFAASDDASNDDADAVVEFDDLADADAPTRIGKADDDPLRDQ